MTVFLRTFGVLATVVALLAGWSHGTSPSASACSTVGFSAPTLPYVIEESTVIAVGRLREATQTAIVLEVEEGLKATSPGQRLLLSNQAFGVSAGCQVYVEPGSGWHLPEEARVIAFLKPDLSGSPELWMPAFFGEGVFEIESDEKPFGPSGAVERVYHLDSLKQAFAELDGVAFDPRLEKIPPCNPLEIDLPSVPRLARLTAAAAVATVEDVNETALTLHTEEVLWGAPGERFTLNRSGFYQGNTCDLVPSGTLGFQPGSRLVVFLYPDEFGAAQWRLGNWGQGALPLNDGWITPLPTLGDVRELLGIAAPVPSPASGPPAVDERPRQASDGEGDSGRGTSPWLWATAAIAVAAGIAAVGVWRWRSR